MPKPGVPFAQRLQCFGHLGLVVTLRVEPMLGRERNGIDHRLTDGRETGRGREEGLALTGLVEAEQEALPLDAFCELAAAEHSLHRPGREQRPKPGIVGL